MQGLLCIIEIRHNRGGVASKAKRHNRSGLEITAPTRKQGREYSDETRHKGGVGAGGGGGAPWKKTKQSANCVFFPVLY